MLHVSLELTFWWEEFDEDEWRLVAFLHRVGKVEVRNPLELTRDPGDRVLNISKVLSIPSILSGTGNPGRVQLRIELQKSRTYLDLNNRISI
jgi:hypothetical protein